MSIRMWKRIGAMLVALVPFSPAGAQQLQKLVFATDSLAQREMEAPMIWNIFKKDARLTWHLAAAVAGLHWIAITVATMISLLT